jgi:hypothetical protein
VTQLVHDLVASTINPERRGGMQIPLMSIFQPLLLGKEETKPIGPTLIHM